MGVTSPHGLPLGSSRCALDGACGYVSESAHGSWPASSCVVGGIPPRDLTVLKAASVPASGLRLSVVIPSYNTAPFVLQSIRSILGQTVSDLEVIVVDDGSTDNSLEVIGSVTDPRLTCVRQDNRGLASARNSGILLARADIIGFCDADDVWYARKAEKHLAVMESDPRTGITFSFSEYLAESGAPTGQFLISRCHEPTARDLIRRNHIGNGSTPLVKKEVFRRAGVFDEGLGSCEDFEMWVRSAALTPLRLRLLPEVLTGYRVRSGSMTTSFESFLLGHRLALQRFRTYVPGFSAADAARSYAEGLRIASRKAFANGQVALSRILFLRALRYSPGLPFSDLRAGGLLLLHLLALPLPVTAQRLVYRAAREVMRQACCLFWQVPQREAHTVSSAESLADGSDCANSLAAALPLLKLKAND